VEIVGFHSYLYIKPRKLLVIRYLDIFLPLLILYKTSINHLLILYQTSTKRKASWGVGNRYSRLGSVIFPRWEQMPGLGSVNKQHLPDNKERLLQNKAPLLQINAPLLQNKEPLLQHKALIRHRVLVEDR